MSDALGIKLICTFNTGLSNIDKALLRKGRLINRYEFKELSVEKAKKIAEINNLPYDGKETITIGDLFNIDSNNQTNAIARKSIGFKR
jgi:ATP-dependent 26S proteasome regulatory subunit